MTYHSIIFREVIVVVITLFLESSFNFTPIIPAPLVIDSLIPCYILVCRVFAIDHETETFEDDACTPDIVKENT